MKIEYNNLYTHFILITQNRFPFIQEINRARIKKYITGIVNNNQSKMYSIYANPEHVHFLISRSPKISEEGFATIVAESSASFIHSNKLCAGAFAWQQSASAFSVSKNDVDRVCKYILNQPEHHKKVTFAEEYEIFMKYYQKTLKWGNKVIRFFKKRKYSVTKVIRFYILISKLAIKSFPNTPSTNLITLVTLNHK